MTEKNNSVEELMRATRSNRNTKNNLIWVVLDCVRKDYLGCYGMTDIYTPAIDRIAGEGVIFNNHISVAPWTNPSITSMLTGLYPHKLGMFKYRQSFPENVKTLYHYLHQRNFKIASFTASEGWFGDNSFTNEVGLTKNIDLILDYLDQFRNDNFLIFAHYWNTHPPYFNKFSINAWYESRDDIINMIKNEGAKGLSQAKQLYKASIERASEELVYGLIEKLDSLGIYDDTYVVITADHGESWGERLYDKSEIDPFGMHGKHLYDEVLRVPLIIKGPAVPGGKTVDFCSRSIDIMPTILDLLGIRLEGDIDGVSLKETIQSEISGLDLPCISETTYIDSPEGDLEKVISKVSYRTKDWKLIRDIQNKTYELYNLRNDSREINNLVTKEIDKFNELRTLLDLGIKSITISAVEEENIRRKLKELGYI